MKAGILILLLLLFGCKKEAIILKVKNLSQYKKTDFIPTLEHKISNDKNYIYCATLLLAWNSIRNQINEPLIIADNYTDLKLLENSKTFLKVLKPEEYNVSAEIDKEFNISARAEFKKPLPFNTQLQAYSKVLTFDGQKIASFGLDGYARAEQLNIVKILYYKNDKNFLIALQPKDNDHEIILFKTDRIYQSMNEMTIEIKKLTQVGIQESKNNKLNWKYNFNQEDRLNIPKFNFNIETNYKKLEGNNFSVKTQEFKIVRAWQRTAFILDESGAKIESEAEIEGIPVESDEEETIPRPKKLVFDKPFLLLLKRKDANHPYFGLWTVNTELITKE
jgi:hypothetical protein